jgi:hypothetical protein
MNETRDSSLGGLLGGIAVVVGILFLGLGFVSARTGQGTDAVDGFLFGGLAFVAGCVILHRRARKARSKENESGHAEPDAAPDEGRP